MVASIVYVLKDMLSFLSPWKIAMDVLKTPTPASHAPNISINRRPGMVLAYRVPQGLRQTLQLAAPATVLQDLSIFLS